MKKILSIILAFTLCFCFVGCENTQQTQSASTLDTPQNVKITKIETLDRIVVQWKAVEHADSYVVNVNGTDDTTINDYYYISLVAPISEYTVTVTAKADGYKDSDASSPVTYKRDSVTLGIRGGSEVRSGSTLQLTSVVNGTVDDRVTWEVVDGADIISIDQNGKVTAKEVTSDKIVSVKATSVFDSSVSERKVLTVTSKSVLTQDMIDQLDEDLIGFEGYLTVNLHTLSGRFYDSASYDVSSAMNGDEWYGKYEVDIGVSSGMYVIKDEDGDAAQIQVSLMNEDDPVKMEDDNGDYLTWEDAGLYNTFRDRGVTLDAFSFNTETWRYEYVGMGDTAEQREADKQDFMSKLVSAANPYEFVPETMSLIIEDGQIAGLYFTSEIDYTLYQGYVAEMELTVALNLGDAVKVSKIEKYKYVEGFHEPLEEAIEKMRSLDNYTTEFLNIGVNYLTYTYDYTGYVETITSDVCHFAPYDFIPSDYSNVTLGNGKREFSGFDYGYVNKTEEKSTDFYNNFYVNEDSSGDPADSLYATRAFNKNFNTAKPSFEFAAELFTSRVTDEETGKMYYYVDYPMSSVATTFYHGMGTDMELYGIYATEGATSGGTAFTPYVVVNPEGYIESAGFYYYLGYLIGVIEIRYYDFNETETDEAILYMLESLETREIPSSWDQFIVSDLLGVIKEGDDFAADVFFAEFLKVEKDNIEDIVPIFNNALDDTFAFALATLNGANKTVSFFYDVSLDIDYSITTSLNKLRDFLLDLGYTRARDNTYSKSYTDKNGMAKIINIQPVDSQLDLFIHVWVTNAPQQV